MKKLCISVMAIGLISNAAFCAETLDDANKAYNEQNYVKAIEIYKTLCEAKEAKACSSLGYMYRNAKGVSENATLAQEYYKKACDAGDKEACSNANW